MLKKLKLVPISVIGMIKGHLQGVTSPNKVSLTNGIDTFSFEDIEDFARLGVDIDSAFIKMMQGHSPLKIIGEDGELMDTIEGFSEEVNHLVEEEKISKINSAWSTGMVLEELKEERFRQKENEGYSCKHDDYHTDGSISDAAACYAHSDPEVAKTLWPWNEEYCKKDKHERRKQLVLAGALIIAEIERLDRKASDEKSQV